MESADRQTGPSWCGSGSWAGSGFTVDLAVYALLVHPFGVYYLVASVVAWFVAVLNNFVLNRHWTFDRARGGRAHAQAIRFLRRERGRGGLSA